MLRKEIAEECDEIPTELFKALGKTEELLLPELRSGIFEEGKRPENLQDTIMLQTENEKIQRNVKNIKRFA